MYNAMIFAVFLPYRVRWTVPMSHGERLSNQGFSLFCTILSSSPRMVPAHRFGIMSLYYAKKLLRKETMNILPLEYVKIRVGRCRRVVRSGLRLSRPNPTFYVFLVVKAISSH